MDQTAEYAITIALFTYVLQSWQSQYFGIQRIIWVLNSSSVLDFLVSIGTSAHVFGHKNGSDSVLYRTIPLFFISNS